MKTKNKLNIDESYETDEPQACEYWECKEEMNGLNHLMIFPVKKFCFDIWLCDKHLKLFKHKLKEVDD